MSRMRSAGCLILILAASVQGARKPEFNVDFFCGWDGYYRAMEWTPVEIQLGSDLKEPFSGSLTVSARQDGLNTLNIVHTFVLTPDIPLTMPLVTKFAFAVDKCDLAIRDERGRTWWQNSINMWELTTQNRMLRVVQEQDLLIGLVGQGQFGLLRLPRETVCTSGRGQGRVCLGNKVPRAVPWDWTGFASLDVLILCDPDWTLLRRQQLNAVREWVSNGGAMLLALGQHPVPQDSPIADLIPFHIGEPRQMAVPAVALEEWGLDSSRPQSVTAWPLFPKSQALLTEKIEAPEAGYLYGTGYAGFGRVAVLAFNPSQLGEEQARHTAEFWMRHIAACLGDTPDSSGAAISVPTREVSRVGSPPWNLQGFQCTTGRGYNIALARNTAAEGENAPGGYNLNDNRFRISMAQSASNRVMEHLYQLRQMRPLSIWWVILTLSALAILLGPVDYLVLKRFDKLPYTWLTSTGWILIFTVGAYYGVQWFRGGDMELRTVSVLDGIADSNCAWATCYSSLFAPRSDDYHLKNLRPNQWWSGVSPSQEELHAYQREASLRQIHCLQVDGGSLPVSLPVSIWTIQSLLSEWPIEEMPFAATVSRPDAATDALAVEVRNTSDSAIRAGFVLLADACADLGAVPARSTQRFELRPRPFQSWARPIESGRRVMRPDGDMPRYPGALGGVADNAFFAQGCLSRTLAMHRSMQSDRALVCVVYEDAPMPFGVEDHSYKTNHIQLARQVVRIANR